MNAETLVGEYPTATENWQKTLGGYQIWSSADVEVEGARVRMTVTVDAEDRYNFNAGQSDIATDIPDDENVRFAQVGLAKGFDVSGEVTRTVEWDLGDPPSEAVVVDQGQPERNPGRTGRTSGPASGRRPPTGPDRTGRREGSVRADRRRGRRAASLPRGVVAVALTAALAACGGSSTGANSEELAMSRPLPESSRGDRGPVRSDLPPLTSRFPPLGAPVGVTWQGGQLGDPRVPGPSTYWIEAVVQLEPALAEELARTPGIEPVDAPAVDDDLVSAVTDGPWLGGDALDDSFRVSRYSGRAFLDVDDAVLVLHLVGGQA